MIAYRPIEKQDLPSVIELCRVENWTSYIQDPDRTWRVFTAPGVCTFVAAQSGQVVGFVQMQSDGFIQAHLSLVLVARDRRRQGLGKSLIRRAFEAAGGERVDLITELAPEFYRSLSHKEWLGFRIYPQVEMGGPV